MSHGTQPKLAGCECGDRSRKETFVVEYGFRLPSALDNRPALEEFERLAPQTIYVSATPGPAN